MLSRDDNDRMTRTGPEAPAGGLLRRYWQPAALVEELDGERPLKAIRLLGENLVLFRDDAGRYGLVGRSCSHRGVDLKFGRLEDGGLRCPLHGWLYDVDGRCLEQPGEPPGSNFHAKIRHTAYPCREANGIVFAYLGPDPAPALPRWDVLAWEHGKRWVQKHSLLECNWLQTMENSVDPAHLFWLHGHTAHLAKQMDHYEEAHEFIQFDYGIMKRRTTPGQTKGDPPRVDQHPLIFPNTLRHVQRAKTNGRIRHNLQFRVPVDDTHTQVFMVLFEPSETERCAADEDAPLEFFDMKDEEGRYRLEHVLPQDAMAWETQGPVHDRTRETLGAADIGIVKFRRLLAKEIETVTRGGRPLGLVDAGDEDRIIEFEVINERIGVTRPETQAGAKVVAKA